MMHHCPDHHHCIEQAIQKAELICQDRKLRFTELRRNVLTLIWQNHQPAKAYDILDQLKVQDTSAKPPTVYRALNFLLESGLIHKLNSLNAYVGCSHPLKHNQCYFLICDDCGEANECCNHHLADAIEQTTQHNQFQTRQTTVEIEGKCQQCAQV